MLGTPFSVCILSLRPVNTISSVVGHDDDVVAVQHLGLAE